MSSSPKKRLVAGYISQELSTRLALYTTIHNTPRAAIIEMMVEHLLDSVPGTEMLQDEVASMLVSKHVVSGRDWKSQRKLHKQWLQRRKLPSNIVEYILSKVEKMIGGR